MKKIRAAITPTPRITPMATPALAPPDMPAEVVELPMAVEEAEAAESVADPVEVAARRSLTSWLVSAVGDAEVTKEVAVLWDSVVDACLAVFSVVSALVVSVL